MSSVTDPQTIFTKRGTLPLINIFAVKDGDPVLPEERYYVPGTDLYLYFRNQVFMCCFSISTTLRDQPATIFVRSIIPSGHILRATELHSLGYSLQKAFPLNSQAPMSNAPPQTTVSYGATCRECKTYNEYAVSDPQFVCYGCRSMR